MLLQKKKKNLGFTRVTGLDPLGVRDQVRFMFFVGRCG